jgi:hypothetical protein
VSIGSGLDWPAAREIAPSLDCVAIEVPAAVCDDLVGCLVAALEVVDLAFLGLCQE